VPSYEELKVHKEKVLNPPVLEDEGTSFLRNFGEKRPSDTNSHPSLTDQQQRTKTTIVATILSNFSYYLTNSQL
jgi:hypothetical protein